MWTNLVERSEGVVQYSQRARYYLQEIGESEVIREILPLQNLEGMTIQVKIASELGSLTCSGWVDSDELPEVERLYAIRREGAADIYWSNLLAPFFNQVVKVRIQVDESQDKRELGDQRGSLTAEECNSLTYGLSSLVQGVSPPYFPRSEVLYSYEENMRKELDPRSVCLQPKDHT